MLPEWCPDKSEMLSGCCRNQCPDVSEIRMDINLNENKCDGILTTVEIRQFTDAKIIMLTSLDEKEIILDSFTSGAVNYVSKSKYMDIPGLIRDAFNNKSPIEVVLNTGIMILTTALLS